VTTLPTAPLVAVGLIGGFAAARYTGRREVGGAVFAAVGAVCARSWLQTCGPGVTGILLGTYLAAMGGSHPLAKKLGAWPSVIVVSAAATGVVHRIVDHSHARF
jgi:hypothetical protein